MKISVQITSQPITANPAWPAEFSGLAGAQIEFAGIVRDTEDGGKISALEYEAYSPMAENEMRRILESLGEKSPCLAVHVVHRVGVIPAGETAIHVGIISKHRGEAFSLLTEFMNRLKQDVPIWKSRALPATIPVAATETPTAKKFLSLDEARAEIVSRCETLPGVRVPLAEAAGRILLETIHADGDHPSHDRSTRDGYAILADDPSGNFQIVDTLHAADWRPRELKNGEAVRVATGAAMPAENLRVVMQEDVERIGEKIKIICRDDAGNVRRRGEEMRAGEPILPPGTELGAGALTLLATVGCTQPLVNPQLRVVHFTTGDEIVAPDQKPRPGQIRDSNSILIRALLANFSCDITQQHLPENFARAKTEIEKSKAEIGSADVLLVSGGASVGDQDFTRPLLEWLGFKIVFGRIDIRPGAPLIFGTNGRRIAFGLPGNPLSHFTCFHVFVAAALAKLSGRKPGVFSSGRLVANLDDAASARETLWPASWEMRNGQIGLTPLRWSSSGDVACLAKANALIRVPANIESLPAGAGVEFLPTNF